MQVAAGGTHEHHISYQVHKLVDLNTSHSLMSFTGSSEVSTSLKSFLIFIATPLIDGCIFLIYSLNNGKQYKTCITEFKKQAFIPEFIGRNKIFGSLATLKSNFLLILFEHSLGDSLLDYPDKF